MKFRILLILMTLLRFAYTEEFNLLESSDSLNVDPFTGEVVNEPEVEKANETIVKNQEELYAAQMALYTGLQVNQVKGLERNLSVFNEKLEKDKIENDGILVDLHCSEAVNLYIALSMPEEGVSEVFREIPISMRTWVSQGSNQREMEKLKMQSWHFEEIEKWYKLEVLISHMNMRQLGNFIVAVSIYGDPTKLDVMLNDRIYKTLARKSHGSFNYQKSDYESWLGIGNFKNPVYRYLGISVMVSVIKDQVELLKIIDLFEDETDPTILELIITELKTFQTKKSKGRLLEVAVKAESRGDEEIAKSAREAVESL